MLELSIVVLIALSLYHQNNVPITTYIKLHWTLSQIHIACVICDTLIILTTQSSTAAALWQRRLNNYIHDNNNPNNINNDSNLHNFWHICVGFFSSREKLEFTSLCLYSMNLSQRVALHLKHMHKVHCLRNIKQNREFNSNKMNSQELTRDGVSLSESTSESFTNNCCFFLAVQYMIWQVIIQH